jgi:hypothetical protein
VNGLLVPEGKTESLCEKAQQLLDPVQLIQLRESTLKYSRAYFASQKNVSKYVELIESK